MASIDELVSELSLNSEREPVASELGGVRDAFRIRSLERCASHAALTFGTQYCNPSTVMMLLNRGHPMGALVRIEPSDTR